METNFYSQLEAISKKATKKIETTLPKGKKHLILYDEEAGDDIMEMPEFPHWDNGGFNDIAHVTEIYRKGKTIMIKGETNEHGQDVTTELSKLDFVGICSLADQISQILKPSIK